jgi:periplasmic divalent cation tolerance protein
MSLNNKEMIILYTTLPNEEIAKSLAFNLIEAKLAACVNVTRAVESFYKWNNIIESTQEVMLLIKTSSDLSDKTTKLIREMHPYEVPCILKLNASCEEESYMKWLKTCLLEG